MVPSCLTIAIFVFLALVDVKASWSYDEKVLLTDIKTLTLHNGKLTTGKRSKPVPQISCVGGSAGCKNFVPQVVQCYNRGSDGIDVQWECKTDMDNAYRFGQIDVICEGYDYADDPYVLKGSCGLEYSLELTEEGMKKHGSQSWHGYDFSGKQNTKSSDRGGFSDLLFIAIVLLFMYAIYRSCLRRQQYSSTADDFDNPDDTHRTTGFGYPNAPPPPGFRQGFTPDPMGDSCGAGMGSRRAGAAPGVGGFWSGAAAGGLLGYMFGNRNNDRYRQPYYSPSPGSSSWGGGSSFSSGSSGTRSASGFGGTRRR